MFCAPRVTLCLSVSRHSYSAIWSTPMIAWHWAGTGATLGRSPLPWSAGGGYPGAMPEIPRTLTAALHQEEDWYIAQCLEVDVVSQGHKIGLEEDSVGRVVTVG